MNKLLGSSPRTSTIGYLIAIDGAVTPFVPENHRWICLMIGAILAAILGRMSKDSNGITAAEAKAALKTEKTIEDERQAAPAATPGN